MPEIVRQNPEKAAEMAAAFNAKMSPASIVEQPTNFGIKPTPIYVYNVGPLEFNEPRYPNHPHLFIKRCPVGEDFILAASMQHPFEEKRFDENGHPFVAYTDGFQEVSRTLNPMNPGTDQNFGNEVSIRAAMNQGSNWNKLGVFWSANYPPKPEEVAAAKARLEKTFREELEFMTREEAKSPESANAQANNISHAAANWFGQSFSWHRSDLTRKAYDAGKVPCGVCGELIQPIARLCIHCGAPTDEEKREKWVERKFRGPGRPKDQDGE